MGPDVEGDGGEVEEDVKVDLVGDSPRVLQVDEPAATMSD